jgi:uncharacterized membrane protein (DUF485 family)
MPPGGLLDNVMAMSREHRANVVRRLFDERSFGDRPTPFGLDRLILAFSLLVVAGFGAAWLSAKITGNRSPTEIGLMVGVAVGLGYWLLVKVGTVIYWAYDKLERAVTRRREAGPFEASWQEASAAAFRALGRTPSAYATGSPVETVNKDLWSVVDDRPRAVVMEAFARLDSLTAAKGRHAVPTAVARAQESLGRLWHLAVHRESTLPPMKAREFLHLCELALDALDRGT